MKRLTRSLPPIGTTATLAADSIDVEARTVEATVYSGARVARFPMFEDPHYLILDVSEKAVDLGRVNRGVAPLLDSHDRSGVGAVIGRVDSAWIAGDAVKARLRFSQRDEVAGVWQDVRDGILGAVSVGAVLHELEEQARPKKGPDSDMAHFHATRWELQEVSMVAVGADPSAQVGLAGAEAHPCRFRLLGGNQMRNRKCAKCSAAVPADHEDHLCPDCGVDLAEAESERDEDARKGRIFQLAQDFQCGDLWAKRHVDAGTSPEVALEDATRQRAKRKRVIDSSISWGDDFDAPGFKLEQMAEGLASRARRVEPSEPGRRYAVATLPELALEALKMRGHGYGHETRTYGGRQRTVELALHTTSDFPLILANVLNKTMQPAYAQAQPTFRLIARERTFRDFRAHNFLKAGDFPVPLQVNEHGEFQSGTMGEASESVTCLTYGRILGISRQILVNDDAGAFNDIALGAARRVLDFENATFYSVCILAGAGLGPTLNEGSAAVYAAGHSNVTGAGALDVTLLGSARQLLMEQTSIDGLKLNTPAQYLLTSPENLTLAEQLLGPLAPAQVSEANPFSGKWTPLADANLTGTRFYVLADPMVGSNYIYGSLEGQAGPFTEVQTGFRIDGIEVKVRRDFGCGAVDFRFGVSGAGA